MAQYARSGGYRTGIGSGGLLTPAVKALLIANVVVFLSQAVLRAGWPRALNDFEDLFALTPAAALGGLRVWQFITYSFLHDTGNLLHILFNMFMLWMFGGEVERALGRRRFLILYFAAAFAGGVCMIPMYRGSVVGASAAVFGVMAVYARLYPYRRLLVWGVFPVRARTLVLVLVGLDLLLAIQGSDSGTAHLAHVGGFALGWFFFRLERSFERFRRTRDIKGADRAERQDAEVRQKVDELLGKVGREGLGSLTEREREFLSRSSGRFRR